MDVDSISQTLKEFLEQGGQGIIEMHCQSNNLASLMSQVLTNKKSCGISKIVICTKTTEEIDPLLEIIKKLNFTGLAFGITHRKGLCLNTSINWKDRLQVENECNRLCSTNQCQYSEGLKSKSDLFLNGVLSMKDVKDMSELGGMCPFFLITRVLSQAEILVCTHQYFFETVYQELKENLTNKSAIIFLDAHSLDSSLMDECSMNLNLNFLSEAIGNIKSILQELETTDAQLKQDYNNTVKNLKVIEMPLIKRSMLPLYASEDVMDKTIPGTIRRPEHFLGFMKRAAVYLRKLLRSKEAKVYSSSRMLHDMKRNAFIDPDLLKFSMISLTSIFLNFKELSNKNYSQLQLLCRFCTILGNSKSHQYVKSIDDTSEFLIVFEPYPESQNDYSPVLQLSCLDCSRALSQILSSFNTSLFISSTFTPSEIYTKLLGLSPDVMKMCIGNSSANYCPLMLTKGSDQLAVSAKSEDRGDEGIMRNYGDLVLELADNIPDGIICYVTGYKYLDDMILKWNETGLLYRLLDQKLVFFESRDVKETQTALYNFKLACVSGRGAVLFCVTNGYAVDFIDMFSNWCRCVVIFGVPIQDVLSRVLKARLSYIKEKLKIEESEMLNYDAMRQAVYCMSKSLRSIDSYALQIFADKRYVFPQKMDKLPAWIKQNLRPNFSSLSTDVLINISKQFLRSASNKRSNVS